MAPTLKPYALNWPYTLNPKALKPLRTTELKEPFAEESTLSDLKPEIGTAR